MSHLIVKNPFLPDSFGLDYDSPRSRSYGLNSTLLRSSPLPFRNPVAGLPRWLNFKISTHAAPPHQHTEALTVSVGSGESQKISQKTSRRDSTLSSSTRSGKSANSANSLRKKVEEHEMKTKTDEWKKNREYRVVRERRNLSKKQTDSKLRLIRCFYLPSIFFIGMGVVFIFGSTIHSVGDGTMFWTFKEKFRIVGMVTIIVGVIMLVVTVGFESHNSEKLKKKRVQEQNPLIHPDFYTKPERYRLHELLRTQTSESSFDENIFLCSSIKSAASSMPKITEKEQNWYNSQPKDADSFQCSIRFNRSASNHVIKVNGEDALIMQGPVFNVANEQEDEAFLQSSIQSVKSSFNSNLYTSTSPCGDQNGRTQNQATP